MDYGEAVSAAIKVARVQVLDVSLEKFGALLGEELNLRQAFVRQTVANWEDRTTKPDSEVLMATARLAGMGLDELIARAYPPWQTVQLRGLEARVRRLEESQRSN